MRDGTISELREIKVKLVSTAYLLTEKVGTYNKEFVDWAIGNLEGYTGSYPSDRMLENLKKLSAKAKEGELEAIQQLQSDDDAGLSLKKFYVPFLEAKLEMISVFGEQIRTCIFEIRSKIQILNEEIDNAQFYFRKTFDSSMSESNFAIVRQNLKTSYSTIRKQVELLVGMINSLLNNQKF